jgi:tetratricopeptide (TPR) repeat protein
MIKLETAIPDRILRIIVISGALLIALVLLIFFGHRAYVHWQAPRLAKQAQAAIQSNDFTRASLLAQRALQLDRGSADAARAVADIADKQGAGDALSWRQFVVKSLPNSIPDRLALVRTALRLGQTKVAQDTLGAIPNQDRENAEYHACAAQLALALNKLEEADAHYQRATELDPKNVVFAFNRAVVELRFLDKRDAAEAALRGISGDEKLRLLAEKALLADAIEHLNWNSALPLVDAIIADPKSEFSDRILRLDILRRAFNPKLSASLEEVQKDAAAKPADAAALLLWMQENERAREGVKWADELSREIRDSSPVKAALALSFITLGEWNSAEALVRSDNWGGLEYLRLAIFARALKERSSGELFQITWEAASSLRIGDGKTNFAKSIGQWSHTARTARQPYDGWNTIIPPRETRLA